MKTSVSRLGALLALFLLPASAEVVQVSPRASHNWLGYMNVFRFFRGICVDLRAGSGVSGALLAAVKRAAGINVGLCSP